MTAALAEQGLGDRDAALEHLAKAGALDPRSANTARRSAVTLLWLRRYPEGRAAVDRALALAPTNLNIIEAEGPDGPAEGNLAGARAVIGAALGTVEPAALLANFALYWDLYWVLDDAQQRRAPRRCPPSAFDDDRGAWEIVRAQTYWLHKDSGKSEGICGLGPTCVRGGCSR